MLHIHHHHRRHDQYRHCQRYCQRQPLRQSQYGDCLQSQHSLPRYQRVRPAQASSGSAGITTPAAAEWEPQPVRAGTAQEVIYALQPLPYIADYADGGQRNSATVISVDNDELPIDGVGAASHTSASHTSAIIVSYLLGAILGVLMAGGVLLGAS